MLFELLMWGGFGLIAGSFVNVLILRHGVQSIRGRSACPHCKTTLQWFELVPVLSWIALLGRCRTCKGSISVQYPLVELLTALGFVLLGAAPISLFLKIIGCGVVLLCIALAVYDTYHFVLPDPWVFSFLFLTLCFSCVGLVYKSAPVSEYVWTIFAGPLVALPLFALWFFSKGAWMGFGDVKFAFGIGWLLDIPLGYLALMYAFVSGAIVGLMLVFFSSDWWKRISTSFTPTTLSRGAQKGVTMKSEVPFGPFLIFGTMFLWIQTLFQIDVLAQFMRFFLLY